MRALIAILLIVPVLIWTGSVQSQQPVDGGLRSIDARAANTTNSRATHPEIGETAPAMKPKSGVTDEIRKMPLRTKVGQLFMIGFMGSSLENGLGTTIRRLKPGAIIVFGRNIRHARQLAELNRDAQALSWKESKLPLLIAVDQEGGDVLRIKTTHPLPSALALGEAGQPELVERAGFATGRLLRTLGFNMNLAPVLDVADPGRRTFIGTRTFGRDAALVAKMGIKFSSGLQRGGALPTAKHFPGHGSVIEDSHKATPSRPVPLQQLTDKDLLPFSRMQEELKAPWAVMLAHVTYPSLDPSGVPATFSKPIVTDLLRGKLGFNGLVVTDDIEMAGAFAVPDTGERAIRAIEAGVDMIMVAWNRRLQYKLVEAVVKAVQSGRLSEERIDESVLRIIEVKRAFSSERYAPSLKEISLALRDPEMKSIALETLTAKLDKPLSAEEAAFREFAKQRPVFVFSANRRFYSSFADGAQARRKRLYHLANSSGFSIDKIMRSNPDAVGLFYLSGSRSAGLANSVSSDVARRMLIVTTEAEGVLRNPERFLHIADVYYRHPNLGRFIGQHYFPSSPAPNPAGEIRAPTSGPK